MTKPCSLQYPPLHILNGGEDISETSMLISCSQILIHVLILCAWFYLHFCQPCNSFFMSPFSLSSTQNLKENKTSLWCAVYIDFCILNSIYLEDFRSWKRYFVFYLFNNSIIWREEFETMTFQVKTTKVVQRLKPKAKIKQNNQTNKPKRLTHGLTRITICWRMRGWPFVSECLDELVND